MIVTTDIPCGNGRVHWIDPQHFEIQVIAYSKTPRYTHFKITGVKRDEEREIILRPDPYFDGDFRGVQGKIWVRRTEAGEWVALPDSEVELSPNAIRFRLKLHQGEECFVSTEPPREYPQTTRELFALAERYPEEASVRVIGHSAEHRPIFLLRVTSANNSAAPGRESRPVIFIFSGEHASEFAGEEMVRGMLALVTARSEEAKSLREQFIFDFVLNMNPDGNYHGWHQYNARDWRAHNYREKTDRSWHHEFEPYFEGELEDASPETRASADWITRVRPAFVLGAHSWLGHDGNPGAFYADPASLGEEMNEKIRLLNHDAKLAGAQFGVDFETYSAVNLCKGHLGGYLMRHNRALAYTIEGHMNMGRKNLQALGAALLQRWLANEGLGLQREAAPEATR